MDERWFFRPAPRASARMRLICFPYAGGSPNVFRTWPAGLPQDIEVVAVRLPGRDSRIREAPFVDWPTLVDATEAALSSLFDRPFAFFGHSYGARLAAELTWRLQHRDRQTPVHLFISGCHCPHVPYRHPLLHDLPRQEFFERIRKMNGTPPGVLSNERLMALFEPTLRADMKLSELWKFSAEQPLNVPLAALSGVYDDLDPPQDMRDWGNYTRAEFSFHTFPGDHFFIHTEESEVLATLAGLCSGSL